MFVSRPGFSRLKLLLTRDGCSLILRDDALLLAMLTPAGELPVFDLREACQRMRAAADVAMRARRIAKDQRMRRYIMRHHGPCAHQGKLADGNTAANDGTAAQRRAIAHNGWSNLPVVGGFERTFRRYGARKEIIGKADMRADKHAVFQCHALEHRGMVLNLYP